MKQALWQLLNDFLSAIFFFAVYSLTGNIVAATTIAIAVGAAQFVRLKLARRAIEPMQWMSLALVIGLGAATLLTQNPRFMMLKPSFIHFAIAAVMLRRGWMSRYLPAIVHRERAAGSDYRGGLCLGRADGRFGSDQPRDRDAVRHQGLGLVHFVRRYRGEIRCARFAICRVPDHGAAPPDPARRNPVTLAPCFRRGSPLYRPASIDGGPEGMPCRRKPATRMPNCPS